jgi:hypothetical protein
MSGKPCHKLYILEIHSSRIRLAGGSASPGSKSSRAIVFSQSKTGTSGCCKAGMTLRTKGIKTASCTHWIFRGADQKAELQANAQDALGLSHGGLARRAAGQALSMLPGWNHENETPSPPSITLQSAADNHIVNSLNPLKFDVMTHCHGDLDQYDLLRRDNGTVDARKTGVDFDKVGTGRVEHG